MSRAPLVGDASTVVGTWSVNDVNGEKPTFRTLVVDDDATMRHVTGLILGRTGRFDVVGEAADGLEAIDMASAHKPEVVLLDITMPRMDGFEALPHIRDVAPEAKVVVLTGLSGEEVRRKALDLGAVALLEKEPDAEKFVRDLLAAVERAPGEAAADGRS